MATDLALLRVSDPRGKVSREIVVTESTTMFNLHRVLQFCIKPRQADSVIDCKPYSFTHVASGKKVDKPKSTQLYRANQSKESTEAEVGDAYTYEADTGLKAGGKEQYLVEVVARESGDARYYVPRCISGNTDLDPINSKLLLRRFPKSGSMTPKEPPKLWCVKGTPREALMGGYLSRMKRPLGAQ